MGCFFLLFILFSLRLIIRLFALGKATKNITFIIFSVYWIAIFRIF